MFNHILHQGKRHFCRYCLQVFSTEEILKCHIKDCFKINGQKKIIMPEKGKYVRLKNYERKKRSLYIIYADFESILVPKDNGKQNPEDSYANKCKKHIACSYGYKFGCVDDKFSKPFETYFGEDAVYNFINSMIKESKYCSEVIKNILTKNLKAIKILRTLLNVVYVTMILLIMMLI